MNFITSADFPSDKLLVNLFTNADLMDANEFLSDFALSLGVEEDQVISPIPYRFKKLGIAYASMEKCKNSMGKLVRDQALGIDFDPYQIRYDIYLKEVAALKQSITKSMLIVEPEDITQSDYSISMDIYRS